MLNTRIFTQLLTTNLKQLNNRGSTYSIICVKSANFDVKASPVYILCLPLRMAISTQILTTSMNARSGKVTHMTIVLPENLHKK